MIKGIRHAGLVVENLERELNFWCDVMGFELQSRQIESGKTIDVTLDFDGTKVETAKLIAPNGYGLELLKFDAPVSSYVKRNSRFATGFTHIALEVDDLKLWLSKLTDLGFVVRSVPEIFFDLRKTKALYVQSPESYWLELVEIGVA